MTNVATKITLNGRAVDFGLTEANTFAFKAILREEPKFEIARYWRPTGEFMGYVASDGGIRTKHYPSANEAFDNYARKRLVVAPGSPFAVEWGNFYRSMRPAIPILTPLRRFAMWFVGVTNGLWRSM